MNKVILIGRFTADPELRQTQNGISSTKFTIAINRKFFNKNISEKQTDYINCIAWRQTAEFITRYFQKGNMVCVEGYLRTGSYPDKKYSEIMHYTTDVNVENVEFVNSKSDRVDYSVTMNKTNSYQETPKQSVHNKTMSYGNLNDFEEIISDGDVPF